MYILNICIAKLISYCDVWTIEKESKYVAREYNHHCNLSNLHYHRIVWKPCCSCY